MGKLTWELLGAAVGAGMASGREIAAFFSRHGRLGSLGVAAAVIAISFLAPASPPERWRGRWQGSVWRILLMLLLIVTGGAMLAGSGEIAALLLPVYAADLIGMSMTFLMAWLLAVRVQSGLAWVSRLLACCLAVMLGVGWILPPEPAIQWSGHEPSSALLSGLMYGGFNAALMSPVLAMTGAPPKVKRRNAAAAAGILGVLLMAGHLTIIRHPALAGEALPFVRMMAHMGRGGMLLSAISLYLAVLSTLIACMRSLRGNPWAIAALLAVSAFGFSDVVEMAYPVLGGACALLLLWMRLANWRKGF